MPELNPRQKREAKSRVAVSAPVVHEAIRLQGEEELSRPASALAWSALAAGLSMGFSFITEGLLAADLPEGAKWAPLLIRGGYPLGFLLVIVGRQQLFTENTLTAVLPLLAKRNLETLARMLRLWIIVLAGNLAGAHVIAWAVSSPAVFKPELQTQFLKLGEEAAAVGFLPALFKAIFAGWLIAMMVWMLAASEARNIGVILILTYIVALGSFTHVIAGSIEVLYLVMAGRLSWPSFFGGYFLPTLIGNTIGGVALVSALNHAQVVAGHANAEES